jgi:hypothetical protein
MNINRISMAAATVVLAAMLGGCTQEADKARVTAAQPIENPTFMRFDFNMPPKDLVALAERVASSPPYSLKVQNKGKGVLTTDWKEYRGSFHIARYWQERTRYQISVSPDFDEPTTKSSLHVAQETQTRASDQGQFYALLDEDRSERAVDLAKAIQAEAMKGAK